jgi:Cu2+-exporting ATPase
MFVAVLLLAGIAVAACHRSADQGGVAAYACPMRCEEDKTYDHPGICPVCGMDLVEVRPDGTLVMPERPHPGAGIP